MELLSSQLVGHTRKPTLLVKFKQGWDLLLASRAVNNSARQGNPIHNILALNRDQRGRRRRLLNRSSQLTGTQAHNYLKKDVCFVFPFFLCCCYRTKFFMFTFFSNSMPEKSYCYALKFNVLIKVSCKKKHGLFLGGYLRPFFSLYFTQSFLSYVFCVLCSTLKVKSLNWVNRQVDFSPSISETTC